MCLYNYMCVFVAIVVFFTGCANSETENQTDVIQLISGTESGRESSQTVSRLLEENYTYTIEMVTYQYKNAYIEYPQILGLAEKTKENNINRLIVYHILGDKIGRPLVFQNVDGLHMELESRVTRQTGGFFSFYCTGKTYLEGDRPTDVFYSMTFDIKEAKELILSDLVDIDETLVDRIKNSTDITNQKLEENPDDETLRESLLAAIQEKDTLQYMEFLAEWEDRFVLEQNALIVTMEVSPDDGDYVLIRIPGQMEGNRFIFDEP